MKITIWDKKEIDSIPFTMPIGMVKVLCNPNIKIKFEPKIKSTKITLWDNSKYKNK